MKRSSVRRGQYLVASLWVSLQTARRVIRGLRILELGAGALVVIVDLLVHRFHEVCPQRQGSPGPR